MTPEFGSSRTAIVTGAAKRIGAEIAAALAADGWDVLIHYRHSADEAEALAARLPRARAVSADLATADGAGKVIAALDGMPPPALLVNSASAFIYDSLDDFSVEAWDMHMAANARGPALLSRAFAGTVPKGQGGLIVNMLDAKLASLNPDFFTYTISKIAFAGLHELLARSLASSRIRVNAIAPSVTLVSGPQSRENFEKVHALNPLGRGVEVSEIVAALRFLIAVPTITGQTITLDGGQRFLGLPRDVQYLDQEP